MRRWACQRHFRRAGFFFARSFSSTSGAPPHDPSPTSPPGRQRITRNLLQGEVCGCRCMPRGGRWAMDVGRVSGVRSRCFLTRNNCSQLPGIGGIMRAWVRFQNLRRKPSPVCSEVFGLPSWRPPGGYSEVPRELSLMWLCIESAKLFDQPYITRNLHTL